MKKTMIILSSVALLSSSSFGMGMGNGQGMGKGNMLQMVNNMGEDMQVKLKYDYLVNLPILMRAVMKNGDAVGLSKEQKMAIKKHKIEVMDNIDPVMQESFQLSKKLKDGLLYGDMSKDEMLKLSSKIADLKEEVLNMKIVCISFIKSTLTKEQFEKLLELDKNMPYLNSPYNY